MTGAERFIASFGELLDTLEKINRAARKARADGSIMEAKAANQYAENLSSYMISKHKDAPK